jgi:hypothetical protein
VDSTYLKADASMRGIVRKDSGEDYRSYIKRVAAEAEAAAAHSSNNDDSDVAPNVVGSAVAGGVPIADVLVPCCVLGVTPLLVLLLPEPT